MSSTPGESIHESISRWMEASWEDPQAPLPDELQEHLRECSSCSSLLVAARRLVGADYRAPEDLSDRVMARIASADAPRRARRGAPAIMAAAMLAFAAVGLGLFVGSSRRTVTVALTLNAPGAHSVAVVGDWNGWDPQAQLLTDVDADGVWEIELRLRRRDEYLYQFVIDESQWTPDPLAVISVEDGYGGVNSVLHL